MGASKRGGVEPTQDWQLLLPLVGCPEQERYEEIHPLVLFDVPVVERAEEVGTSVSTLYRRLDRFAEEGMGSLFDAPRAKRKRLPPVLLAKDMFDLRTGDRRHAAVSPRARPGTDAPRPAASPAPAPRPGSLP